MISTDLFDEKLDYAVKLGADHVINVKNSVLKEEVTRIIKGKGANSGFKGFYGRPEGYCDGRTPMIL